MKFLIDFSWFRYQCLDFYHKGNLEFTYSTDLDSFNLQDFNKLFFDNLKKICSDLDFFSKLEKNNNFHSVNLNERKKIGRIFEKYGEDVSKVQQNIIDCDYIYQIRIKDNKRRFFFILDRKQWQVTPLIIDLNHLIYPNCNIKNNYKNCLICHKSNSKCQQQQNKDLS